ncbi:cell division protein FtsL [Palleronia sp.]|uniref:cell division protein FtsL n=1 Tax=Palleronia sp. TaxID=1940284 RepID=UPI0035C80CD3
MRTILFVLPGFAVMALAFWAYSENYETQESLAHVRDLQRRIGAERETLAILKAEWAYLNRPERLRALVDLNFERLALLPLQPFHFADVDQIPYPTPDLEDIVDVIPLKGELP